VLYPVTVFGTGTVSDKKSEDGLFCNILHSALHPARNFCPQPQSPLFPNLMQSLAVILVREVKQLYEYSRSPHS